MKKILLFALFFAHFAAINCLASPIYVVDVQRVIDESILGKAAKSTIEAEVKKEGAKLQQIEREMASLKKDFEAQAAVLSGSALEEKQELLRKKERDFSSSYQDKRNALARKNKQEIQKVVSEIDKAINELSKKNGYAFVLEGDPRFVVYAEKSLDLTDEIIKYLDNQKLG